MNSPKVSDTRVAPISPSSKKKAPRRQANKWLPLLAQPKFMALAAVVVIAVVAGGVFGVKYVIENIINKKDDTVQVLKDVKQIFPYLLPSEVPTVATVTDVSKLGGQEFFRNAQNGDRVLVFSVAKIAIIYRNSSRAIVNFGPISAPAVTPTPSSLLPAPAVTAAPIVTPAALITPVPAKK